MSANDLTNLRKAALALHALPDQDRLRVWARLDERQHEALTPLLDELTNLGIPHGRAWTDPEREEAAEQSALVDEARRCRAVVWGVRARQVLPVLTSQSLDTAVTVMSIAKWPWLDEVLESWPADQRHTVRGRLAHDRKVPAALADQLLQSMASALLANGSGRQTEPARRPRSFRLHSLFGLF